jgi:hypothetical protein
VGQYIEKAMARSGGNSNNMLTALKNAPSEVADYISTTYGNVKNYVSSLNLDSKFDPEEERRQEELKKKRRALAALKAQGKTA